MGERYQNSKKSVKDVLKVAKLFFCYVSKTVEPFLTRFQKNQPIVPFLYKIIIMSPVGNSLSIPVLNGAGSKLHEDKIARGVKIALRVKFARRRFCTKTSLHEETNLHKGTKLHKDKFALRVNFARATNLHGCQICTRGLVCTG